MSSDVVGGDDGRKGRNGELLVKEFLKYYGWGTDTVPPYDSTGAPLIESDISDLIRPDIFVMKNGEGRWVEVKTRETYGELRKKNQKRHAMPLNNWRSYCRVQHLLGFEVWIFYFEIRTGTLLRADIDSIEVVQIISEEGEQGWNAYGEPTVLFARDSFEGIPAQVQAGDCFFGQKKLGTDDDQTSDDGFRVDDDGVWGNQSEFEDFAEGWDE